LGYKGTIQPQGFLHTEVMYSSSIMTHSKSGARQTGNVDIFIWASKAQQRMDMYFATGKGILLRYTDLRSPAAHPMLKDEKGATANTTEKARGKMMAIIDLACNPSGGILTLGGTMVDVAAAAFLGHNTTVFENNPHQFKSGVRRVKRDMDRAAADPSFIQTVTLDEYCCYFRTRVYAYACMSPRDVERGEEWEEEMLGGVRERIVSDLKRVAYPPAAKAVIAEGVARSDKSKATVTSQIKADAKKKKKKTPKMLDVLQ
jgi:hypothetical protein